MKKKFNITGTCIPEKHYMVNIENKLNKIISLIEEEEYFIINRPRQYGKTTTLYMLEKALEKNNEYLTVSISFEGVGDLIFQEEQRFSKGFLSLIERSFFMGNEALVEFIEDHKSKVESMDGLSYFITKFIKKVDKKVILMIDEVDKSGNNQLFLSFLGMLRNKYLLRDANKDFTFHSVILAGVHDVKSLKLKLRPEEEQKYNSPWNIATNFNIDMSFSKNEIMTMIDEYAVEKNVKMDKEYFSEKIHYYTSGYPFLVSKLCKIIDEEFMIEGNFQWENEYMDKAVKELLKDDNTNFDSLIKNLENNSSLKDLIKKIIIDGNKITYNKDNPVIMLGIIFGIFKSENGEVKIHNRIYEQRIYNYMSSLMETSLNLSFYNDRVKFIKENSTLDIKEILIKFQDFMKHEYSEKRDAFLEADGCMVFLAFLSPIINGVGFAFKEVTGGEEKRFDIVITYEKKMYILELKIWHGEEYHKKGLLQLGEYLHQYALEEGYLLVFDFRKERNKDRNVEEIEIKGKKIFAVWV